MKRFTSAVTLLAFFSLQLPQTQASLPVMDSVNELSSQLSYVENYLQTGLQRLVQGNTEKIETNTTDIMDKTQMIQSDTQHMRAVLDQRQGLIKSVGQLQLLMQYGLAVTQDDVSGQIVTALEEMMKDPISAAKKAGDFKIGNTDFSSGINQLSNMASTASSAGSFLSGLGGSGGGSGLSGLSGELGGILNNGANVSSLLNSGSSISGLGDALNPLTGGLGNVTSMVSQFVGQVNQMWQVFGSNIGFAEDMIGLGGTSISLDRQPPMAMMGIAGSSASHLQDLQQGVQQAASPFKSMLSETSTLLGNTNEAASAVSHLFGNGMYVHKAQPLDNAYYALVQNGSAQSQMAFFASVNYGGGAYYDPRTGALQPGMALNRKLNLNDTFTGGAYTTMDNFNKRNNLKGNPYGDFAPGIASALQKEWSPTPGTRYSPDIKFLERAKEMKPMDLLHFPKIAVFDAGSLNRRTGGRSPAMLALMNPFGSFGGKMSGFRQVADAAPTTTVGSDTVVLTLTTEEQSEYEAHIAASDVRLAQIAVMAGINNLMLQYTRKVLVSLQNLRDALQKTAGQMNDATAVESVGMMLLNCNNMLVLLNQQIADYALSLERLMSERNGELTARADYKKAWVLAVRRTAPYRLSQALQTRAWKNNLDDHVSGAPSTKTSFISRVSPYHLAMSSQEVLVK